MPTLLPCGPVIGKTYIQSGAGAALQYHIMKLSAVSTAAVAGANDPCLGVLKNTPADGGQASLVTRGETEVAVDAATAIVAGDYIVANASGRGIKIPATAALKSNVLGRAMEALASGTGTIIVDVLPIVITNPAA